MAKITQTAGRNALGTFAPEFAHFNDDVLCNLCHDIKPPSFYLW